MATSFETTTCSRCGGTGKYSYNQMDGDRCYGCGGSGITLSKRGNKARTKFYESLTRHASEIQPGMFLREYGKWLRVTEITKDTLNEGRIIVSLAVKGGYGINMFEISKVQFGAKEEINAALEVALTYQNSLKK